MTHANVLRRFALQRIGNINTWRHWRLGGAYWWAWLAWHHSGKSTVGRLGKTPQCWR